MKILFEGLGWVLILMWGFQSLAGNPLDVSFTLPVTDTLTAYVLLGMAGYGIGQMMLVQFIDEVLKLVKMIKRSP